MGCTVQVVLREYEAVRIKNHGRLADAIKQCYEGTGGAADLIKTIKACATLCGNHRLADKCGGYLGLAAIPHTYCALKNVAESAQEFDIESPRAVNKLLCNGFDAASTAINAFTTVSAEYPKALPETARVLGAAKDVFDAGVWTSDVCSYTKLSKLLKDRADIPNVQSAIRSKAAYSCLKLAKAIASIAAGVFACFTIFTGAALVSPVTAVVVALTATMFNISAFYYKNYISEFDLSERVCVKTV